MKNCNGKAANERSASEVVDAELIVSQRSSTGLVTRRVVTLNVLCLLLPWEEVLRPLAGLRLLSHLGEGRDTLAGKRM